MDAWRGFDGVHRKAPKHRPTRARECSPLPPWIIHLAPPKLRDTADGLRYLHSCNIVHGDLKGVRDNSESRFTILTSGQPNVLVDAAGHARITDFGLAQDLDAMQSALNDQGRTVRWTAPEILNEEGTFSKEADVFSFAMVMIEVHHRLPFVPSFGLQLNIGVHRRGSVQQ